MITSQDEKPRGKVAHLLRKYDLNGLGAELEARWMTDGDERMSLRDPADYFNREVLTAALRKAGEQSLEGEVENTYWVLTSDEVGVADKTRVRR